jgi:hypothetical protein
MVLDATLTTETHAQMTVADRRAPSSQRGGQGFESPQLHRRSSEALARLGEGLRSFDREATARELVTHPRQLVTQLEDPASATAPANGAPVSEPATTSWPTTWRSFPAGRPLGAP